ncbi:MAG: hypothetical protein HN580_18000 [Deltaproteobacteria bacterium]|nr:hypothetical protein [Deltaproteobacteria bacterium]MBT4089126.1 hypothetical protein [Deltaproteobacteria bacterium]MBT4263205.1 hypothetical protein [Deltaproteobacteria bacterium]MBT4640953.1 hypothetical protein [Deltaproteobacteria bacterium]MBT6501828.1 hypothetical protein [Deltaproteobacteria bacterium]
MGKSVIRLSLVFALGIMLLASQQKAFAQDEGPPALQKLAFFTLGGAAGGIVFGVALWMLDPLAPSADIRLNALSGMGGGSIIGFIFGMMQLNQQATFPYRQPTYSDEFEEGLNLPPLMSPELRELRYAQYKPRPQGIPLFQVNYRF